MSNLSIGEIIQKLQEIPTDNWDEEICLYVPVTGTYFGIKDIGNDNDDEMYELLLGDESVIYDDDVDIHYEAPQITEDIDLDNAV